jgi:hypothetical protein
VHREISFGEITKSKICRRFQVRKECVRVKLRRDSDKDPTERERYIEWSQSDGWDPFGRNQDH